MEEEKVYKIVLADGTEIENLTLNGNNFISKTELHPETFANNCSPMKIVYDGTEEVHEHAELVQIMPFNGEWWLAFRDITARELADMKTRSDIEYIAMMSDIDLEEG